MEEVKLNDNTEINLQEISFCERFKGGQYVEPPPAYIRSVSLMLEVMHIYTTQAEVMKEHNAETWEQVLSIEPYRYLEASEPDKIIDIQADLIITPDNPFYNTLFACTIRHTTLFNIDKFLDYHLARYYGNNLKAFSKFLRLLIRQYAEVGDVIPKAEAVTVLEWMKEKAEEEKEQAAPLSGTGEKGEKITRRRDDGLTKLSQEQTVLLLQYLKEMGAFLPDRLLPNTIAARAFSQLTGYSANTMRQDWVNYPNLETVENLEKLYNLFTKLSIHANNKLPGKKPKG